VAAVTGEWVALARAVDKNLQLLARGGRNRWVEPVQLEVRNAAHVVERALLLRQVWSGDRAEPPTATVPIGAVLREAAGEGVSVGLAVEALRWLHNSGFVFLRDQVAPQYLSRLEVG
jgi:hypothetical protein